MSELPPQSTSTTPIISNIDNRTLTQYPITWKHSIHHTLERRSLGLRPYIGYQDDIMSKIYHNLDLCDLGHNSKLKTCSSGDTGGIFNLEFSLDGSVLMAACERSQILMYDVQSQTRLTVIENAHHSCVNCIRFFNSHMFATCSDDYMVKLWDLRNMRTDVIKLEGHQNWVKNIEFCHKENMMVTSAFDGTILGWDLKRFSNCTVLDKLFHINGLVRMKLTPDCSKMVMCTTSGYIIVVHDLHLPTLSNDMRLFKPALYRLMQVSGQSFPAGTIYNYLFSPTRKRNRIELIDDFTIDAKLISSLQIHPHGWTCLSRCSNGQESQEVTSVHDIQKLDTITYEHYRNDGSEDGGSDSDDSCPDQRPADVWIGYISNAQYNSNEEGENRGSAFENFQMPAMGIINSGLIGRNSYHDHFQTSPEDRDKVITNHPRLTHYKTEKNVGKGFIKEVCFSSDGRVIGSPYGNGIRVLGFDENCRELTYCVPSKPRPLSTVLEIDNFHKDCVVSCKFSPVESLLVSGCLGGKIGWYRPVL